MYQNITANINFNRENLDMSSLKSDIRQDVSFSPLYLSLHEKRLCNKINNVRGIRTENKLRRGWRHITQILK